MDGLAIAAAIVQFIDVAGKVVSNTASIRRSLEGQLDEHREIEEVTNALARDARNIQQCIEKRRDRSTWTDADREQEKIGQDCQDLAEQLLDVLGKLKRKSGGRKNEGHKQSQWRSLRQALQTLWREDEIRALEKRLNRFRQQMIVIILDTLRQKAESLAQQQSSILETVGEIKELHKDTQSVGRAFLRELEEGERWRRDLIRAIHQSTTSTSTPKTFEPRAVDEENAAQIQQRVLQSLRFREMADREYRIPKAHQETLQWIFEDEKSQAGNKKPLTGFKPFLEGDDEQLYWITGKPGSGKSTLMKFLRHHADTFEFLKTWTEGSPVIFSHFYFWNSGSDMQMTVEGLLQTLLYECLRQMPFTIATVFPERWEVFRLIGEDDYPLAWHELSTALRKLILDVGHNHKFFTMIDGLDECAGDQSRLTDLIMELINSTNNLKVVVASRPWTNFQDTFQERPHLKLEDLTLDDINRYITSKFEACEGFHELIERDQEYAGGLLQAIADKAEGVFLWVHLVVNSLLAGLANGDRMCDLQRRLDGLPPRLEDLFERMLEGLEPGYMSHASQLFQLVRAASICPSLLGLALADLDDRARVLRAQVKPLSKEQKLVYCKNMKRKLMSRCRGLLEATTHKPEARGQTDGPDSRLKHIRSTHPGSALYDSLNPKPCDSCSDVMFTLRVQYLHRTVKDYIEDPNVWKWLVSANNDLTFNPHLGWVESYLAQIKGLDPECLTRDLFWDNVSWCLDYAKRSGRVTSSETEARLLDELNLACTSLFLSTCKDGQMVADKLMLEAGAEQNPDIHWTATLITWIPRPSFLYLMAMCGMHRYINSRMASTTTRTHASHRSRPPASSTHQDAQDVQDSEPGDQTASLLFAATDDFLTLSQFEDRKSLYRETPYVETVKVLLRKGENPYVFFNGRSPWTIAKAMADRDESDYPDIVRLYLKHAGPPPVHNLADTRDRTRLRPGANHNSRVSDGTDPLTQENLSQIPTDAGLVVPNSTSQFAEYEFSQWTAYRAESNRTPPPVSPHPRNSHRMGPPPRMPRPSSPSPSSSSSLSSSTTTTTEPVASPPLRPATRVPHRPRDYYPTRSPDRDGHRLPSRRSRSAMAFRTHRLPSPRADLDADDNVSVTPTPARRHRRERRDRYPPPVEPRAPWPTQQYSGPYYAHPRTVPPLYSPFAPPSVRAPLPFQRIPGYVRPPRIGNPTEFEPGHFSLQQRHAPMGGYGPGPVLRDYPGPIWIQPELSRWRRPSESYYA